MRIKIWKLKKFSGFWSESGEMYGLKFLKFCLGFFIIQLTRGELDSEVKKSIEAGLKEVREGKVVPWSDIKKELGL